jgi:hypothetical protein
MKLVEDGVELCFEQLFEGQVRRMVLRGRLRTYVELKFAVFTRDDVKIYLDTTKMEVTSVNVRKTCPAEPTLWFWFYHVAELPEWTLRRITWKETFFESARQSAVALFWGLGQGAIAGMDVHMRRRIASRLMATSEDERWRNVN